MKRTVNFLPKIFLIFSLIALGSCATEEKEEETVRYRTPSRSEISDMEKRAKDKLSTEGKNASTTHFYDIGKNYAIYACETSPSADSYGDGCEIMLYVFHCVDNVWELIGSNINLGQSGAYGGCEFTREDVTFFTEGKNVVGSFYTTESHRGETHSIVALFSIDKNDIHFSDAIEVEADNSGNIVDENDPTFTSWKSEFNFEGEKVPEFHLVSTGIRSGEKYNQVRHFVLEGKTFKEKSKK
jgi:hypothetical protein